MSRRRRESRFLRENGLLLACLGLFGVFFLGMIDLGRGHLQPRTAVTMAPHEQVSVRQVSNHRRLRRGDV